MNRGAVRALALGQIVTAVVLLVVAVYGYQRGAEVDALRAELADTRSRLVAAERDRDRLQDRVDALTAALLTAGVDPNTVPAEPATDQSAREADEQDEPTVSAAPRQQAPEDPPPAPRAAEPSPEPQPSPSPPSDPPPTCVLGPFPLLCPR